MILIPHLYPIFSHEKPILQVVYKAHDRALCDQTFIICIYNHVSESSNLFKQYFILYRLHGTKQLYRT